MNFLHNKALLLKITKYCLFLAILFPLIRGTSANWESYIIFQRTIYVQILVCLAIICYSLLIINFKEYRPKTNLLLYSFIAFLSLNLISMLVSVNMEGSFWGSFRRMTGLLPLIHYFLLFFIAYHVLTEKKDWLKIFYGYAIVSTILGFSGFFLKQDGRLGGLNVNPLFLSQTLFFGIFISYYLFSISQSKKIKNYFLLPVIIFQIVCLVLTGSRGYFMALILSGLIIFCGWLFKNYKNKKISLAIISAIAVLLIIFSINFFTPQEKKPEFLLKMPAPIQKIADFSFYTATFQIRYEYWKITLKGLTGSHLWLGYGQSNFYYLYERNVSPDIFRFGYNESFPDQAHSVIFDTLAGTGILGLLSYLALIGCAIYTNYKNYQDKKISWQNHLVFLALIIGYFIGGLIMFDLIFSYVLLFLIFAYIQAINIEGKNTKLSDKKYDNLFKIIAAAVIILGLYDIIFLNFVQYGKYLKFEKADTKGTVESFDNALNQDAFMTNFFLDTISKKYLTLPVERIEGTIEQMLIASKKDAEKNKSLKSYYTYSYLLQVKSEIYQQKNINRDSLFEEANNTIGTMLEINPNYPPTHALITKIYFEQEKYDKAIEAGQKALSLYPTLPDALWIMSKSYYFLNDFEKSIEFLNKAQSAGFVIFGERNIQILKTYLEATKIKSSYADIVFNYVNGIKSTDPAVYAKILLLPQEYYNNGKKDLAKILAEKIISVDPSQKNNLENFIK